LPGFDLERFAGRNETAEFNIRDSAGHPGRIICGRDLFRKDSSGLKVGVH